MFVFFLKLKKYFKFKFDLIIFIFLFCYLIYLSFVLPINLNYFLNNIVYKYQDSSSDSPSLSSTSFISALSSQEDITLVNLHMQVNRPIVDSPLLMASYVTHLAQVRCMNWSHCSLPYGADAFSVPLFQQNEDGGLVYIGRFSFNVKILSIVINPFVFFPFRWKISTSL